MNLRTRNLCLAILFAGISAGLSANVAYSQKPAPTVLRPFEPAEELVYEAEFSRALLRKVDVADFRLTSRRPLKNLNAAGDDKGATDALVLTCNITSKGFFAKLFGLRFRETLESTVDPVSFTVRNSKRVDEHGKRVRSSEAVFDKANGKILWTERDPKDPARAPRVVSSNFTGQVHDILSAIYFLRTQQLPVGKSLDISISDSGQVYTVPVRVLERKRLKTVLGRVDAVLVEATLFGPRGMIDGEGKFFMWFTEDTRRIPVSVKIKSEYGTFDIKLKKVVHQPDAQQYLTQQE